MAYVTTPDRRTARRITRAVLERRLAACANLVPIESLYWWQGQLQQTPEILIVFKTRKRLAPRLIRAVAALHAYEVPCIVTYAMDAGHAPYLAWIDAETRDHR